MLNPDDPSFRDFKTSIRAIFFDLDGTLIDTDDAALEALAGRLERWRSSRDAEALGELLKWQRDRAFATALRILGRAADAEDAVQEAFAKLLSRTSGFEGQEELRIAVYRAVVQCALDMVRSDRARARREEAMRDRVQPSMSDPEKKLEQKDAII